MEQPLISSDLIRGHLDTIILSSLMDSDKTVLQITEFIKEKSENDYIINQATLYSSLKRLTTNNYIVDYWHDFKAEGRRKFFKITDLGVNFAKESLYSWGKSRLIIDKLMNYKPNNEIKTIIIEKPSPEISTTKNNENSIKISNPTSQPKDNTFNTQNDTDINFRSVLKDLIDTTVAKTDNNEEKTVLEPLNAKINDEEKEVKRFNQTKIPDEETENLNKNGKIDYSDLVIKASKDGLKVKISSKDALSPCNGIFINKVRFFSSLIVLLLFAIELGLLVGLTKFNDIITLSITSSVYVLYMIISMLIYLIKPYKALSYKIKKDGILTSFIVMFNIILITFALNLLFQIDFEDINLIVKTLILPLTLSLNLPIYFIIRFILTNKKSMKQSKK